VAQVLTRVALVLAVGSACSSESDPSVRADAAVPDVPACVDDTEYVWVDLPGTTPKGGFGNLHYARSYWCESYYLVDVREHPRCTSDGENSPGGGELVVAIQAQPPVAAGTILELNASFGAQPGVYEPMGFTVSTLSESVISGRFAIDDGGWDVDFNLALATHFESCLLD